MTTPTPIDTTEDSAELATLALDVQDLAQKAVLDLYRNDLDAVAQGLDAIRDRLDVKKEPQS